MTTVEPETAGGVSETYVRERLEQFAAAALGIRRS
jgi:hypothetical protein